MLEMIAMENGSREDRRQQLSLIGPQKSFSPVQSHDQPLDHF